MRGKILKIIAKIVMATVILGGGVSGCSEPAPSNETLLNTSPQNASTSASFPSAAVPPAPVQAADTANDGFAIKSTDPNKLDEYVRFSFDRDENHLKAFEYAIKSVGKLCDAVSVSYQLLKDEVPFDVHKVYCADGHIYQISSFAGDPYVRKWTDNNNAREAIQAIQHYQAN
jgi:hypothetical protein